MRSHSYTWKGRSCRKLYELFKAMMVRKESKLEMGEGKPGTEICESFSIPWVA